MLFFNASAKGRQVHSDSHGEKARQSVKLACNAGGQSVVRSLLASNCEVNGLPFGIKRLASGVPAKRGKASDPALVFVWASLPYVCVAAPFQALT